MSLKRLSQGRQARTRQTQLYELVEVIFSDPGVNRALFNLRAGVREEAAVGALQRHFGGETLRVYVPSRKVAADEIARRVRAMAASPSCMAPAQIAEQLGITPRHVRRILARES